ncbi:MAG TPA: TAXI family TRAP transporter solute-binding subunit, partial [Thermodesulfobacteriota bacterium]|nr:TAXI family TRAP transporter solute-binding subunit [Thermodesulfobacteriota bacterium]
MTMKRFKAGVGIAIACVLVLSTAAWAAPKFISIATGGTGGAYFPIGAGLADIINKHLTGYNASAEVTAASKVNCINVNDGKSDLALVLGDTLAYAYKGDKLGGFTKPLANLRVIANIYPNTIQIVARKDSGVRTLFDLKGKKVSVGAPGSGTEINARQIFAAAGMTYKDFGRTDYLSFSESADQMKNRALDVTLISSGMPNPGIMDIATSQDIVIVPIEGDVLKRLHKEHPFFVA